ncbi:MAG TPA: 30S ribosomal protein S8 [bacterium]|jgi:small subunit ribosomal protein S8|nr:30S ribosomal protein S8 [bacterium]
MSMNDPISDMLTRIRNAANAKHEKADVPSSRLKTEIVKILKDEGYVKNYRLLEEQERPFIRVYFKRVEGGQKVITDLKRVSKPGLRVYVDKHSIPNVLGGMGTAVLSTSKGLMTDRKARELGVGGEHLFNIW